MNGWILEQCEDAWVNYLTGSVTASAVNCYHGMDELTKTGPAIVAFATEASEVELGSGIYQTTIVIHYSYPFDSDGLDTRNALGENLMQALYNNSNIINDLTGSTANLNILALQFNAHNNGFDGDCWVSNNQVEMVVAHK